MSTNSLKKHLDLIRKKGHEIQKKNGHFSRMGKRSAEVRKLLKKNVKSH